MVKHTRYLLIVLLLVVPIAGCTSLRNTEDNTPIQKNEKVQETIVKDSAALPPQEKVREPEISKLDALTSQLQTSIRQSGEISPETFEEITNKIKYFEANNYPKEKIQELKEILATFKVGGQAEEMPKEIIIEKEKTPQEVNSSIVIWQYRDEKWKPTGNPPACPDPLLFQLPVDVDLPSSVLYPGQVRGNDFKPHGGFRTDGTTGPVEVRAPMEGYVWRVARFYDEFGIHYMFDIQHPCGIMHRLGHLGAVPPKLEAIFDTIPTQEGSQTTELKEPVFVDLGEVIATNTQEGSGFDWGVYDLRQENKASQDSVFREAHKDEAAQAYHALCWLDYLPSKEKAIVGSLPAADGVSGKNSDYC